MVYKRLFPSPRGRKAEPEYDEMFHEREMARAFGAKGAKIPSYTDLASRIVGFGDRRQRVIRAFQRRKKSLRLPDPPKNRRTKRGASTLAVPRNRNR
jgi:hypothetical protein